MDVKKALPKLVEAVVRGGQLAKRMQGSVQSHDKESEDMPNDTSELRKSRGLVTDADELVQVTILQSIIDVGGADKIFLDAEEITDLTGEFSNEFQGITLVIDPIDGTANYVAGGDGYLVCVGLFEDHQPRILVVYFPARGELYHMDARGSCWLTVAGKKSELVGSSGGRFRIGVCKRASTEREDRADEAGGL